MKTEDRTAFLIALTKLAEVFGRQLTPIVIDAWFESLEPYPIALVVDALNEWTATNNTGFMPVPGQIADVINARPRRTDLRGLPSGERYPTAEEAKEFLATLREIVAEGARGHWATRSGPRGPRPVTSDPGAPGGHKAQSADHE